MPTYTFKCKKCAHVLEEIYSMSKAPKTIKCPECGKRMKRMIGAGATLIFKGSWPGKDLKINENLAKKILENAPPDQLGE